MEVARRRDIEYRLAKLEFRSRKAELSPASRAALKEIAAALRVPGPWPTSAASDTRRASAPTAEEA